MKIVSHVYVFNTEVKTVLVALAIREYTKS